MKYRVMQFDQQNKCFVGPVHSFDNYVDATNWINNEFICRPVAMRLTGTDKIITDLIPRPEYRIFLDTSEGISDQEIRTAVDSDPLLHAIYFLGYQQGREDYGI